ncbi:hypothetical protein C9374_005669 [Naegleria lovaniensis]|uniref:Uncharacterized protein n=1 Tax=Naegleria lovaniensis TaxID=51637 RepID=A0AA88GP85_NAELO|nr:uncharacterized protein C9374_005669 [Naegleria lovaniensis]KAG2381877.1 hypothetical protein C9374_005669 [Naegleria lovaniensis]
MTELDKEKKEIHPCFVLTLPTPSNITNDHQVNGFEETIRAIQRKLQNETWQDEDQTLGRPLSGGSNVIMIVSSANNTLTIYDCYNISIKQILAAEERTLFLTTEGEVYCCSAAGKPFQKLDIADPIEMISSRRQLLLVTKDKRVYFNESYDMALDKLVKWHDIDYPWPKDQEYPVDVSAGSTHILILTNVGNVYGFGQNYGQLGFAYGGVAYANVWRKSETSHITGKIIRVFTTYNTSFILTNEGKLYTCGDRSYGASGLPNDTNTPTHYWTLVPKLETEFVTDVRTGLFFVAVLCKSSNVYIFGYFNFYQFGRIASTNAGVNSTPMLLDTFDQTNIEDIACGGYNSMILTKNKEVYVGGVGRNALNPNNSGEYSKLEWAQILKQVYTGCTFSNSNVSMHMGNTFYALHISKNTSVLRFFNFRNIWKVADVIFQFE